jgi:hypothetical protein
MKAKVSISFVLILGLTMVTSSFFVTGLPVLAKENGSESDGGGESSGSDSGGVMVAATVVIQITAAEVAMTILLMTTRAKTSWKAILDQNNKKIMG